MMGGRTPETCCAVNKRQANKLENCCIWLVIYLNCTMMHGLTKLKCGDVLFVLAQIGSWTCFKEEGCLIIGSKVATSAARGKT